MKKKNKLKDINKITIRLAQAAALTVSCLVSLPTFAQLGCSWDASNGVVTCPYDDSDPWGDPDPDPGCNVIGCDSDGDDGGSSPPPPPPPQQCPAHRSASLRALKQSTPGCIGNPGPVFDTTEWFANETGSFWNWFTNPIGVVWYDSMLGPVTWLANTLDNNNGNQTAAYSQFQSQMWTQACANVWGSTPGNVNDTVHGRCLYSVYYVLETYYPGTNISATIFNWLLGTNFSTAQYDQTWGGRLAQDVNHFATCRDIYQAWDDENCGGSL